MWTVLEASLPKGSGATRSRLTGNANARPANQQAKDGRDWQLRSFKLPKLVAGPTASPTTQGTGSTRPVVTGTTEA